MVSYSDPDSAQSDKYIQSPTPQQKQQEIRDKVKEQLILSNLLSSQRVFSSADYLQIDFDSSTRAKQVMTTINKIRLMLTREMLSQNNLI